MKNGSGILFLYLAAMLGLASCSNNQQGQPSTEILVGEFGSLTGTTATFGISTRNGIDMAIDEVNKDGWSAGEESAGHRRR